MDGQEDVPYSLTLEGPKALRLLAHEARQRVLAEIYDGHALTATEAARLCGLTPSAMSYHLRMLERAGAVIAEPSGDDGRERRYRRAARTFEVRGSGRGANVDVHLQATVGIWIDSLTRAAGRWLRADAGRSGGMYTESLRLTETEHEQLLDRLRELFREYEQVSDGNDQGAPQWEMYWAHIPRVPDDVG